MESLENSVFYLAVNPAEIFQLVFMIAYGKSIDRGTGIFPGCDVRWLACDVVLWLYPCSYAPGHEALFKG